MHFRKTWALSVLAAVTAFPGAAAAASCVAPHSIKRVSNSAGVLSEFVTFYIVGSPNRPFTVATAHPPFVADPSGQPVSVAGAKFKSITFRDVFWTCTIRENLSLPRRAVKDVKKLGQFEGVVEYVVGYRAASRYVATNAVKIGSNWRVVMRFRR